MYPLNHEITAERLYVAEFHRFADPLQDRAIKWIKENVPEQKPEQKSDADDTEIFSVRLDADSLPDLLLEMRKEYGQYVPPDIFKRRMAANVHLIDAHAKALVNRSVEKVNGKDTVRRLISKDLVQTKTGLKPSVGGVNMISGSITEDFTKAAIKQNINLVGKLHDKYTDAVDEVLRKGFIASKSQKELIADIMHVSKATETEARFWAQDQAGNFFSEINRKRSEAAGFPGYIWRTQSDRHVRDTHARLEGTYHRWDDPPDVPSKKGGPIRKLHPGKDYRCRCWADSAAGEHEADRKYEDPLPHEIKQSVYEFKPVATIKEAEQYAMSLGVKNPQYKNRDNIDMANYANKVLTQYKNAGHEMPKAVIAEKKLFEKLSDDILDIPAAYRNGIIYLNEEVDFSRVYLDYLDAFKDGAWSSDHPAHIMRHEMGHFLHHKKIGTLQLVTLRNKKVADIHKPIMRKVSSYAVTTYLEFVAEVHAALMNGQKFDDAVMSLYNNLKGI